MTADEIYQQTNDDLAGLNGEAERERTLEGLVKLQTLVMQDQIIVFGSQNVRVMQTPDDMLISMKQ